MSTNPDGAFEPAVGDTAAVTPHGSSDEVAPSTMSYTGGFSQHLAVLIAGGMTPEDSEAIASLPAGSALLVVRRGSNAGARFLLDADSTIAGRHPNADIFLDDVTVSRRHAEINRVGGKFRMRDLGSLNGSFYNGERVDTADLSDGGEVQIGKYRMTFYASRFDTQAL